MTTSLADQHAMRLAHADAHAAAQGLALTPLRRQVYAAIVASGRPIGAYELLDLLAPERGRMPPTTVYRARSTSSSRTASCTGSSRRTRSSPAAKSACRIAASS